MKNRLRHLLGQLFSTEGFRGPVLTLLSGTTVVLVISYLSQLILMRLYTPEEYGVLHFFMAVLVVLASFSSLRYEDALMLPDDEEEAASVVWLALLLLGFFAALCGVLLIWREEIAALLNMSALIPWLFLIPPTLLLMRGSRIAEWWLIRSKRFRPIAAGQITSVVSMVTTRIGAGLPPMNAGAGGLIGGTIVGHMASFLVLGWYTLRQSARVLFSSFRWSRIPIVARRYRRFPLYSTPSTLLAAVISRLPILLIPQFFDEATAETVVGLFGQAFAMLAIPLSHIGEAIARVFFVHAAEAHREQRLTEVTLTVHQRLVMFGLFPTLALLLAGPDVFEVVFGSEWREAGTFIQYVGLWFFLASVASPLTRLFDVLERQRLDFALSALMFVALTTALIVGGKTGNVITLLLLIGAAGAGVRIIQLAVLLRLADGSLNAALRAYGRYFLFSLPGLFLIAGALQLGNAWATTGAVGVAGLLYGIVVLWKDQLLTPYRKAS
ncbi:MAG: oligosaccharide flippase family protein [Rhodothermales bacterium]